jgi:hypothetical protein
VNGGEIGFGVLAAAGRSGPMAEQKLIQPVVAKIFRQRPTQLGSLCQLQVFVNGALDDGTTASDLVLLETQG